MYIKSQNRNFVINVDFILISDKEGHTNEIYAIKNDDRVRLGKYCGRDRAQEVFDTICDRLEDGMDFIESDNGQSFKRHMIFEMPIK